VDLVGKFWHGPVMPDAWAKETDMDALFYALPLAIAASAIFATIGVELFL